MNDKNIKHLILIELNEINFDVVEKYVKTNPARFPALKNLLSGFYIRTSSETRYEELEPWIQWASVHTTKTYAEHKIFRLGDIVESKVPQIFEQLELAGFKVGAISAMNADNRLKKPAYFIPDPWTQTNADSSWWSKILSTAISQLVNDNSQARVTPKSAFYVMLGLLRFARTRNYLKYISLVLTSKRNPWKKALILDLLLHDIHWSLFNKKKPNFSTLFLNAGAHIQHHYFLNATPLRKESLNKNPSWYVSERADPLADALDIYNQIVSDYFSRKDVDIVLATGLSQKPYDQVKFYYRLNNHADFLRELGIPFRGVYPRMTRDFLIEFNNNQEAVDAQNILTNVRIVDDETPLFGEIDNRGDSLFVTMTYPKEITADTKYQLGKDKWLLASKVSFVAIKNGMHHDEGFAFFTPGAMQYAPANKAHVAHIGLTIKNYFGLTH